MGTEKRDRQRANKQMKNAQAVRAESRSKNTRFGVIVVGAIVAVVLIAFVANQVTGGDDEASNDTLPAVTDDANVADTGGETGGDPSPAGAVFEATGEFVPEGCPSPDGSADQQQSFDTAPEMCLDPAKDYSAVVTTNKGEFTIAFDQERAPEAVNSFVYLARQQYFDDTFCHRIIIDFVVQCGDPDGTGRGGPGYQFPDELPAAGEYEVGSIAMANSGPDTNGSQFFIITGPAGIALPPAYSLFGEVTENYDPTVLAMTEAASVDGTPSEVIDILSVEIVTN